MLTSWGGRRASSLEHTSSPAHTKAENSVWSGLHCVWSSRHKQLTITVSIKTAGSGLCRGPFATTQSILEVARFCYHFFFFQKGLKVILFLIPASLWMRVWHLCNGNNTLLGLQFLDHTFAPWETHRCSSLLFLDFNVAVKKDETRCIYLPFK